MFLLYYEKVRFNVPSKSSFRASNSLKFGIFRGFAPSALEQIYSAPRSHSHGSVLEEKWLFKMLGLTFSSKLDWGSYIISIAKSASRKIGVLIYSMKFLSHEVALYLYKSSIRQCMEYCVMSGLVLLFANWNCWISYRNEFAGLLVLHVLPPLNHWLIIEI